MVRKYLLALGTIASFPAMAAEPDQSEESPANIIVVATKASPMLQDVPLAINAVERRLEAIAPIAIIDALATTPGVTVSRNGGIGGFSAVRIRGAEGEQTLALIDDVRVNDPSSPGGGFDFGTLLSMNVSQVIVERGPNSVAWGSQAIGGIVRIFTPEPGNDLSGEAKAEYGSHDAASLSGQIGAKTGPFSLSLGGGYFVDDGISAAATGSERDGFRQYAAMGKARLDIGKRVSLDLRGFYTKSRSQSDGFPPPFFELADTGEFSKAQQVTGYLGLNANLPDNRLNNRFAFTLADINRDNFDPAMGPAPAFVARGRSERFEYGGSSELSKAMKLVFGAEHETTRFNDGISAFATHVTSGFVQAVLTPVKPVELTIGARVDDHKAFGTKTTLGSTLLITLSDFTRITANFGEGFKAPTLFQLFSFFGTPTLKPESSTGFDIGINQYLWDRKVQLIASYFQRRTRNQIDFDLSSFTYGNIAQSRASGIESRLEFRPSHRFIGFVSFTVTDSKGRSSAASPFARLLRRPKYAFAASADWYPNEKLTFGATLLTNSHSLDGFGGTTLLRGYTVVSARAGWKLTPDIEFYIRGANLFDTRYQTVAGYGSYGRTIHAGARFRF